MKTKLHKS